MHKNISDNLNIIIAFDNAEERKKILEKIDSNIYLYRDGYLSTYQFFKNMNIIYPKSISCNNVIGWYINEIKNIATYIKDISDDEFIYIMQIVAPHVIDLNYAKELITSYNTSRNTIEKSTKNLPIDDGGDRIQYGENGAIREPSAGKGRFDLISPFGLQRIAKWYELESKKYSERNWEKGIPYSRCVDSAMCHMNKFIMGMTDEDHLAAAAWNIIAIMHFEMTGRDDLDDLPHFIKKLSENVCKPLFSDNLKENKEEKRNESNI